LGQISFDDVLRDLAGGVISRREAIRRLAGAVLGLGGLARFDESVARKRRNTCNKISDKKRRKKCIKRTRARDRQAAPPDPTASATLLAAGDIADCDSDGDEATAALLEGLAGTVATLGDTVYEAGTASEFAQCYDPSWGRHKSRTRPAVGNHEYLTAEAAGYFGYFGAAAGDPTKGYYSYDLGAWHIVVLNSNCSKVVGGCDAGSPQEQWLRQDLAANPTACTLAYWHHPRFSFGAYSDDTRTQALWQALYEAGAEIVLTGHDHNYQRYAPQDADGLRDDARGIRQFVVGTGGKSNTSLKTPPPNVEAFNGATDGILQLTLHPTSYNWRFIPIAGQSFTDAGSGVCH
jgi:acid phosphatase type 7